MNKIAEPIIENNVPFVLIETKRIQFHEWAKLPDCPFQRNTEARAAHATHLLKFDDSHRRVTVGVLPGGKRYKVDGHTREFIWRNGMAEGVPSPLWLNADIYQCVSGDRDSLGALYDRFDSRMAVQTASDDVHSAANELGLAFTSPMMQRGRYGGAVKRLWNIVKRDYGMKHSDPRLTYACIHYFKRELTLFDATDPKHTDYVAATMMAAVITFMRHGSDASPFWVKYGNNEGTKRERAVDGVHAARNLLSEIRREKLHGRSNDVDLVGKYINAFERWRSNEFYTGKSGLPQPKDSSELQRYIDLAVRAKGISQ